MTPLSSMTLADSSPISAPKPRSSPPLVPGPLGPTPSDVMTPQRRRFGHAHLACAANQWSCEDITVRRTEKPKMHSCTQIGGSLCTSCSIVLVSVGDERRQDRSNVFAD